MPLTFLSPWFAVAGILAAAAVVAAHLISARTRAPAPLPTTRFVVRRQERSAAVERRPRDIVLLLLRGGALALTGFALARPITAPLEGPTVRIAIADAAGAANPGEIVTRAKEIAGDDGRVVISDATVRVIDARDDGDGGQPSAAPLSLTAALVSAIREAGRFGARGSPVELAIVSGFARSALDSATTAVRALWPGAMQLVDVPSSARQAERGPLTLRGEADDPIRAMAELLPTGSGAPTIIVRGAWTRADSLAASEGATVVHWPRAGIVSSFGAPVTAAAAATPTDTVRGVWAGGHTLVASFTRVAALTGGDDARVVAWWIDGNAAAVERTLGAGCVRLVALSVPEEGDLSISPGFQRIAAALTGPCGAVRDSTPLDTADRAMLAGSGPREITLHAASASLMRSRFAAPLLLGALLALLVEPVVRRRS